MSSAFTDAPLDVPMGILLPHRFPKRPLRIEIVGRFSDVKRYSNLGVHWTTGTNIPHSRSWHLDVTTHKPLTTTVVYLYDRYLIKVVAGQVMAIRCYDEPYPADRILMSFTNLIVEKLIVRNVEVQDLPQEFLDPLALAEKYKFQDDDETFILPVKPPTDEAKP